MSRLIASLAAAAGLLATTSAWGVEISISCSALGKEYEICKQGVDAWAAKTGNTVKIVSTPNSATERLALFQQLLAAGAGDIDVFQIDVVWTGTLGNHLLDLTSKGQAIIGDHLPAMVETSRVEGKLMAIPWFADAGLLYYRKDLLDKYKRPVPETWADLGETARLIQEGERKEGKADFWGYTWQGRAYEGLTTNALEWVASHNGGTIVDEKGEVTIENPKAAEALKAAAGWVGTITPEGVLNYTEEEARGIFQAGNAAFMRNWPYAWALAQGGDSTIKDKVGIAPLPKGGADGRHAGTLGGQLLAVSKYSKNTDAATDLVMYLTSEAEQKRRAVAGSFNPTIVSLYSDTDISRANPFIGDLVDVFSNAVARPATVTGQNYNKVSTEFFNAVHQVLSKKSDPSQALNRLDRDLKRIKRNGWQ
ncbi:ABC transporter substrate-binding protein [Microvirga terrae]|uniref:ABC transporter substrate-binding protein n=1 Tax=Microvirga terrae TaxID=2740529 RepID=A0ABY5RPI9_9HYPH|nr:MULTISPECIES: ABC transporter substrate-binding protein [Microvirga]MBQ0823864.1 ABC transporter substrate-binding protein [Microvirga sp. HBU67558]UVF17919.1 ABC transporter substrate-binding protein [Microvirga terrae]